MLIKIALNGVRTKSENIFVPHSLEEIEREVRLLYDLGFLVFHIHCYDKYGNESLASTDVKILVNLVKNISNKIKIGVSSGEWIEPDLEKRLALINSWEIYPDFVSVNLIEDNSLEVITVLFEKGIKYEAGLNDKKAAEIFLSQKNINGCCRILIEPEHDNLNLAIQSIENIEKILGDLQIERLLHGFNSISWDLLQIAKQKGYATRVGMEDMIYLPNGKLVTSNIEIINEVKKIVTI